MKTWWLAGSFAALVASVAPAQGATIDHRAPACAVAETFPRLEARFSPPESVAVARIVFQGESRAEWYAVAMKSEGPTFTGVLPKPKRSLKAFRYYIEVTDKALGTTRTPEFTVSVTSSSGACKGGLAAATVASSSVLVEGPAGAGALPGGFSPTGVTAAGSAAGSTAGAAGSGGAIGTAGAVGVAGAAVATGGGLSGVAVAGIVVGAGAVAGVAAAAGKGGGDNNATSGSSPAPTPTPSTSYSGPFSVQMVIQFTNTGGPGGCQTTTSSHTGTLTITLPPPSGGTFAGTAKVSGTRLVVANTGNCGGPGNVVGDTIGIDWTLPVTGGAGNLTFSGLNSAEAISFSGALNGGIITGTLTLTHSLSTSVGTQSGSASTTVTLR